MTSSLADLPGRYRLILCDLWGCIHDGVAAFPEAVTLLRTWRAQNRYVILLTNAPRPSAAVRLQLDRLGVTRDCYNDVVSSGDAGIAYSMKHHAGQDIGFLGSPADRNALSAAGLAVVNDTLQKITICTGFEPAHQNDLGFYEPMLVDMARRDALMLCFNPDLLVMRGGVPELCAGAIAKRYAALDGKVYYFGKPHRPIYDRAIDIATRALGQRLEAEEVLAVGDSVSTDFLGAKATGIDFVFVSGGIESEEFNRLGAAAFFSEAAEKLGSGGLVPLHSVARLA